jgi:hypothetical protein
VTPFPGLARGWFPVSMRAISEDDDPDVNLCQRLQQFATRGETVLSELIVARFGILPRRRGAAGNQLVKGRDTPVVAHRVRVHDHINQGVLQ